MSTLPTARRLELLTWYPASEPSDAHTTVLMNHAQEDASEPVWPGYQETEDGPWCCAEGTLMPAPRFWADMPAGADLVASDDTAENVLQVARELIAHCQSAGLVLTVEQRPLTPLAQGNYETVASVRPAVQR